MFTGLVDAVGVIDRVRASNAGRELRIRAPYSDVKLGESIAANGACLTVRDVGAGFFDVAAVVTTLDRTTVGSWNVGTRVNLERAMRATDRLGGHVVQGHVDAVGGVTELEMRDDALLINIAVPPDIDQLLVPHGSVTVDGVSLTVNELPAPGILQVSLIEYTRRHTTLGDLAVGDSVHLEGDVIGKFVRRLLQPYQRG
ncbi:MAG: riboflavin synthase [Gemmatimonadaceae bacterium]